MLERSRLSPDDAVPIDHVADGVDGLRILMVNVFAVTTDDGWVLVDAGLPGSGAFIASWGESRFGGRAPECVVLTHGHFDHVGGLEHLLELWPVPVYAHPLEKKYLDGTAQYPAPDASAGGGMTAVLAPFYPSGPLDISKHLQMLPPAEAVPRLKEWRFLHTPGHTEGHVSFFRERDRVLLAGDAFCTTVQEPATATATQRPELDGPPALYTSDWEHARESVQRLAELQPDVLAPSHGLPLAGKEAAGKLAQLAADFDRLARPRKVA